MTEQKRLKDIKEEIIKNIDGRELVCIMSYGSHNYGTNDETSDYDWKAFVMPSIEDLYDNKKFHLGKKHGFSPLGDDVDVYDIRKFIELIGKNNPTFVEMLEAKFTYFNDKYASIKNFLRDNVEEISSFNINKYLSSLKGMSSEKLKAIETDKPTQPTNEGYKRRMIYGYDTKQLLHVVRNVAMGNAILNNMESGHPPTPLDYIDLRSHNDSTFALYGLIENLKNIKSNKSSMTKEEALKYGTKLLSTFDLRRKEWEKTNPVTPNTSILDELGDIIKKETKNSIKKQINNPIRK